MKEEKDELNVMTVTFKAPWWMKSVGVWLAKQDPYALFFKVLGTLTVAPLAGFLTILAFQIPMPSFFIVAGISIVILGIVALFWADEPYVTSKDVFWNWILSTIVWFAISGLGIVEIFLMTKLWQG